MKLCKKGRLFISAVILIFMCNIIFSYSITVYAASDWPDILKQYPDGECAFVDMNADNKSELFVRGNDKSKIIVYANLNDTYTEAGTIPIPYDEETPYLFPVSDNKGIVATDPSGNGQCKYVLKGNKLEQDVAFGSSEQSDEFRTMYVWSQTFKTCNTNDWYTAYKNIIDQYINILDEDVDSAGLDEKYKDVNRNYFICSGYSIFCPALYALKDLDSNGTPELLIAYDMTEEINEYEIFNIYTFKNGVLVEFEKDMGGRRVCHILDNNEISKDGSGSAYDLFYYIYKLNDGRFENTLNMYGYFSSGRGDSIEEYTTLNGVDYDGVDKWNSVHEQGEKRIVEPDWKTIFKYKDENPNTGLAGNNKSEQTSSINGGENETISSQGMFGPIREIFLLIADKIGEFFHKVFKISNTPDWTSVLKQYPDSSCAFEDINADNNPELLIFSESDFIVYTPDEKTYQLAGSVSYEGDWNIKFFSDHNGFVVEKYGNYQINYYKYVLSDGKLVQDDSLRKITYVDRDGDRYNDITSGDFKRWEMGEDVAGYSIHFQPYYICDADDWHSAYKNVIDQYIRFESESINSDSEYLQSTYKYVKGDYYLALESNEHISYLLKDLDDNGTPELITAFGINDHPDTPHGLYELLNIYTFKDGLLIALEGPVNNQNRCYVLNDNEIYYANTDVNQNCYGLYKLNDGVLENISISNYYYYFTDSSESECEYEAYKNGIPIDYSSKDTLEKEIEAKMEQLDWKSVTEFENE